jgi:hypothetical protein
MDKVNLKNYLNDRKNNKSEANQELKYFLSADKLTELVIVNESALDTKLHDNIYKRMFREFVAYVFSFDTLPEHPNYKFLSQLADEHEKNKLTQTLRTIGYLCDKKYEEAVKYQDALLAKNCFYDIQTVWETGENKSYFGGI